MLELLVLLIVVGTSIWVLADASSIGARKGLIPGSAFDMGPGGWFVSCLLLWIVAFPLYLANRDKIAAAIKDPYSALSAATGKTVMRARSPRVGKWRDPVEAWDGGSSKPAGAPTPKISIATVQCPLCTRPIPAVSVRIGTNKCPECDGVFEAEAG